MTAPTRLPLARKDELIVRQMPDETLVYDLKRDKAHCLNRSSALVWKHCDGSTTVTKAAALISRELSITINEDFVRLALSQLDKFHLLERRLTPMSEPQRVSRRRLVRTLGTAAVLLPVIISISAPVAVSAATCKPDQSSCTTSGECCSGCCSEDVGGNTCQPAEVCRPR